MIAHLNFVFLNFNQMWTKDQLPGQSGKTVMVTGANTGIGYETALAFYEAGAHVVLACRSADNARQAIRQLQARGGNGSLEAISLDLADLNAVQQCAATFKENHKELHLLINNAGVMLPPASKTVQGYELQFGVNYIGHFALTAYLYPLLLATPGARIITLSSMAYLHGTIDFGNLKSERDYEPMREYCQSKLADIMFSVTLQEKITAMGHPVLSIAAQPGANKTDLSRYMTTEEYAAAVDRIGELMDPWQGALPSLYAAVSDEAKGGRLYGPDGPGGYRGYPAESPITAHALDGEVAAQLWAVAEEAMGIRFPL